VKGGLQTPRAQGTFGCGNCHVPQARPSLAAPILEWREYSGGISNLKALESVAGTCRRSPLPYEWQGRGMHLAAALDLRSTAGQVVNARQGAIYGMRMAG
jgi:hypothetical protein